MNDLINNKKDILLIGEEFYIQLLIDWNVLKKDSYYVIENDTFWSKNISIISIDKTEVNSDRYFIVYCGLDNYLKTNNYYKYDLDFFNENIINNNGTLEYDGKLYLIDDVKYVSSAPKYMEKAYPRIQSDRLKEYLHELSLAPAGRIVNEKGEICLFDYKSKYINQKNGNRVTINDSKKNNKKNNKRIFIYGDSRVSGFMLEDKDLFSNILQQYLNKKEYKYNVINKGIPGRDIERMAYQVKSTDINKDDIVILMTGCYEYRNNSYEKQYQFALHICDIKKYCDNVGAHFIYINLPTTIEMHKKSLEEEYIIDIYKRYKFCEYDLETIENHKIFLFNELNNHGILTLDLKYDFNNFNEELLFINLHHYSPKGNEVLAKKLLSLIDNINTIYNKNIGKKYYEIANININNYVTNEKNKYNIINRVRFSIGGYKALKTKIGKLKLTIQIFAILKEIINSLRKKKYGYNGAIVMNANPFTNGHKYLVDYAYKKVDVLYVFVLEEDKSYYSFYDRLYMVFLALKKYNNVIVLPSGNDIISNDTFPEYFRKKELQDKMINAYKDIERFCLTVAPYKNIKVRFLGEEPNDNVTRQYNEQMKNVLPRYGIDAEEIKRKEFDNDIISASKVRKAIEENNIEYIKNIVPASTYKYIKKL